MHGFSKRSCSSFTSLNLVSGRFAIVAALCNISVVAALGNSGASPHVPFAATIDDQVPPKYYMRKESRKLPSEEALEVSTGAAFMSAPQAVDDTDIEHVLQDTPSSQGVALTQSGSAAFLDSENHPMVAHWHLDNVNNNANTFEKISGSDAYDAEAVTQHGNVMSIKVRAKQTDKAFRVGLTSNEFDHADYEHGYFIGFYDRGRLYVPDWTISSYTQEDEFGLIVESGKMTLWKNDAKIHTFTGAVPGPMYAAVYIHDVGAKAQITEMAITANLGVGGDQTIVLANQGPNGAAGEVGPPGPPGVTGQAGDPGPPATIEMMFAPAPQGVDGPEGEEGPPGPEGEIGPPGPEGGMGPPGPTGVINALDSRSWEETIKELDAAIKRAADMDKEERMKSDARLSNLLGHLGQVEVALTEQERLEKEEEAKQRAEREEAIRAAAEEAATKKALEAVEEADDAVEGDATAARNEMINVVEVAAGAPSPTVPG